MSLEPGQVIDGKYRIVRLIGEGGMGSVFEGENTFIARRVAIKVLHAAAAQNAQVLTRFEREAQAAGRIGSDHILEILDLGRLENSDRYMVMEFLDGEVLTDRIAKNRVLTPQELYPLIRQTLVGLGAAHGAGIVHRDLKPDNIFILREKAGHKDFVKIIDFGISKFSALSGDMSMTSTGAVMGTPYYMSPEQAKGGTVDARTDIYAVGVILFEGLTGSVPFNGTSFNDLMFKIVLSEIPPLPEGVDPTFAAIVRKAMAREVGERYQSTQELLAALDSWAEEGGFAKSSTVVEARPKLSTGADALEKDHAKARTAANWAATQGDEEALPKKKLSVPLLAGGGVALAAVAVLGVMFSRPAPSEEPAQGPAVAPAAVPVSAPQSAPSPAAPPVAAPVEPAAAQSAPAPSSPQPATSTASSAPAAPAAKPIAATAKPAPAQKPAPVAKPTPSAAKPATTSSKPASKPSGPDFGY